MSKINSNEIFFVIEESVEGGYEAKALGHKIYTEAESIDELKKNIREAVECHFDKPDMPHVVHLNYLKQEILML